MMKKQVHKISTGLAVHTNLAAGLGPGDKGYLESCFAKSRYDVIKACEEARNKRVRDGMDRGESTKEMWLCMDSC